MPSMLAAFTTALFAFAAMQAQPPVDFSGKWTLEPPKIALTPAVPGTPAAAAAPGDLGSGWGTTLTITQDATRLSVEYPIFSRYDLQPPVKFICPLDGSMGRNTVAMGRGCGCIAANAISTIVERSANRSVTTVPSVASIEGSIVRQCG